MLICSFTCDVLYILPKQGQTATILPFFLNRGFCRNEHLVSPAIRAYPKLPPLSVYPNHFFACIIISGMILYRTGIWHNNRKFSRFTFHICYDAIWRAEYLLP